MFDFFGKKRREADQQRKIEQLLRTQEEFLALYAQPSRQETLQDEVANVKVSIERGLTNRG